MKSRLSLFQNSFLQNGSVADVYMSQRFVKQNILVQNESFEHTTLGEMSTENVRAVHNLFLDTEVRFYQLATSLENDWIFTNCIFEYI
jgi:hypothetical protein